MEKYIKIQPIKPFDLKKVVDDRGFFMEVFRTDWYDYAFPLSQAMLSVSHPGVIRAWHRHVRGQNDCLTVIRGSARIAYYHEIEKAFYEATLTGENPQLVYIPGHYWHGTKALGTEDTWTIYFINKHYDYEKPDEERLPPDHIFEGGRYLW